MKNTKNTKKSAQNPITTANNLFTVIKTKRAKITLNIMTLVILSFVMAVPAFAVGGANPGDAMFQNVVEFFATWIGRVGLVVGFIGAIMFGLAIKNDDADAKTRGLMTLAAGFVVFAVTKALDMFMMN